MQYTMFVILLLLFVLKNFELNPPKQHIQMLWNMNNLFTFYGNNADAFLTVYYFKNGNEMLKNIQAFEIKCTNLCEEVREIIKKEE